MRALGFCVSVEHARFMAAQVPRPPACAAAALDTGSPGRRSARDAPAPPALGELQILFAVDLFNEGLDIPEIDTVLFLRPTESALVFLQQLGRGLACPAPQELPHRLGLHRPGTPPLPLRPALPRPARRHAPAAGKAN